MPNIVTYNWLAADNAAIAQLQPVTANVPMIINGPLALSAPQPFASYTNISRTVSITSAADIHTVNFTIVGTYNGLPQSAVITGVHADTIETDPDTGLFDTITSITPDSTAVGQASVGSGTGGYTAWFKADLKLINYIGGVSAFVFPGGTVSYTLQVTMEVDNTLADVYVVDPTGIMTTQANSHVAATGVANVTAGTVIPVPWPWTYLRWQMEQHVGVNTGAVRFTALQNGLK